VPDHDPADTPRPPASVEDWLEITRSALTQGRVAEARRAVLRGIAATDPLWVEAGTIAVAQGDRALLRRVVAALGPLELRNTGWARRVARWADRAGDDELLEAAVAVLLDKSPDGISGLRLRASLVRRRHGLDAAREQLRDGGPAQRTALALVEVEYGDPERGVQALAKLDPTQDLLLLSGNIALRRGMWALALTQWRALDDDTARTRIAEVHADQRVRDGSWTPSFVVPRHRAPRPGRVLHLVGRSLPTTSSGYTVRTHNVLLAQRTAGLDVAAVTQLGFPAGSTKGRQRVDEIEYYRVEPSADATVRLDERLDRNLDGLAYRTSRWRPAALHAHSDFRNGLLALALRDRIGTPVVYEARGFWEESWVSSQPDEETALASEQYRSYQAVEERCMREADRVVTLAEVMKEHIVSRGIPADHVTVVPNAVDPERFHPVDREPALLRQFGLEEVGCVIGYVSSVRPLERIEDLVRATALLRERGLDVALLVVGDGPTLPRLRELARELGLGDRAVFPGGVPHADVLRHYALIDVFVVPRGNDRVSRLVTPLKPFEALATGRALAVSDIPALREIVEAGETGVVFRANDPLSLAGTVQPLVEDAELRRTLGETGREWVLQERTWAHAGRRYRELYDGLL
jgi:glycosyltransferase involved in cell wall biosynthesis